MFSIRNSFMHVLSLSYSYLHLSIFYLYFLLCPLIQIYSCLPSIFFIRVFFQPDHFHSCLIIFTISCSCPLFVFGDINLLNDMQLGASEFYCPSHYIRISWIFSLSPPHSLLIPPSLTSSDSFSRFLSQQFSLIFFLSWVGYRPLFLNRVVISPTLLVIRKYSVILSFHLLIFLELYVFLSFLSSMIFLNRRTPLEACNIWFQKYYLLTYHYLITLRPEFSYLF